MRVSAPSHWQVMKKKMKTSISMAGGVVWLEGRGQDQRVHLKENQYNQSLSIQWCRRLKKTRKLMRRISFWRSWKLKINYSKKNSKVFSKIQEPMSAQTHFSQFHSLSQIFLNMMSKIWSDLIIYLYKTAKKRIQREF